MASYLYQARDTQGQLISGTLSADSVDEAGQALRAEGKFIIKLDAAPAGVAEGNQVATPTAKVKRREVIFFCHQLAVMLQTGVPVSDALECIQGQMTDPNFQAVVADISTHVQAGGEFSAALRKHPRTFPNVMVSLVRASELSGTMGDMLERVSAYLTKEDQTIRRAKGAMMYPLVMLCVAAAVTLFLLTFVLPRFAGIYESRGAALPLPTRMLLGASEVLLGYWWMWLSGLVIVVAGFVAYKRTPTGRRTLDAAKLRLPIVGKLYTQLYITRACRTMGTMLTAGIAMLDMIAIVKQVTNNAFYDDLWDEVDERLRQGAQLSEPLFASDLIPRSISQMIHSGEKSGQLGKVVGRIADFTEEEFDDAIKSTTQFIEPIMMACMGVMIGFVAISLLLPIFSVGQVVASG